MSGLLLLWPVFLVIAAAIRLDTKGPVFFVHKRIGQSGKTLRLYKFRTMVPDAEERIKSFAPEQKLEFEKNYKLDNDPRITRVGRFLRSTSLDELPQLLNILQGNLSFVGPRPLVEKELEKYGPDKDKFLSVKPGLTGYWQVNGRSAVSYDDRIKLELFYIEHQSLSFDFFIFLKTFFVVFARHGAI